MEQKILNEIYRTQQLMGVKREILSEAAINPKPYIEVAQDFFQKLYQKNKSVADDILSNYLTKIGKQMSDELIERLMRGELAQDLSEIEAKGLLEAIQTATKSSSAYKNIINDVFKETISEKPDLFAKIVLDNPRINNQISYLESGILNNNITQDAANKYYRELLDSVNKSYPGIYNELKKQIEERIGRSVDEIGTYEKTNIRSRLQDLGKKAKSEASDFWNTKGQFLDMTGAEYLRYWKYTRFVNDFALFYEKQIKSLWSKSSNLDVKINEFFSSLETELPLLFNSVVEKWSKDLSSNTNAFIKLDEYSEFFRKIMTKFESLTMEVSSHSEDDIEKLIDIFKENPEFKKLATEKQNLMIDQLRKELTTLNPGTQPLWIWEVLGDTVLGNIWKEITESRWGIVKSIFNSMKRFSLSMIFGTFKTWTERKLFLKQYDKLFPLFRRVPMPGFKEGVKKITRYSVLMFISHFVFPFAWGLMKGIFLPLYNGFMVLLGEPNPNPDYDDPNKSILQIYFNDIVKSINDAFSDTFSPVTIFGESNEETEFGVDWLATAAKWLIPVPVGTVKDLYELTIGGIAYFGGAGFNDDYRKAQDELNQKIDEYKRQGIEAIKARMKELERDGEVLSDEYKALKQALEELERNQQNGGDSNQNGGGGGTPVVDPNPAPEISGLEQGMKNTFDNWARANNKTVSWDNFQNNTGYVTIDGVSNILVKRAGDGSTIVIVTNPPIILQR